MKQFKTSMLLVAMLMTAQTAIHADASNMQSPADNTERTWQDFLNQYKYHIAGAAAVGGAVTLGIIYQDEFKDWFASLSPQKQEEVRAEMQDQAQQDAQDVQNIQEDVSEQLAQVQDAIDNQDASATTTKEIATTQAAIVEQLEEMKEKQQEIGWFQRIANFLGSKNSPYTGNDPDMLAIQAEIDANNAPSDEDYRSSYFARDEDEDQGDNGKPAYITTLGNVAYSSFLGKPNQAHGHIDKYYPSFKADFQSKANASDDSSSSNNDSAAAPAPQEIPMNQLITIEGQEVRDLDVPVDTRTANRESVAAGESVIENNYLSQKQSIDKAADLIARVEAIKNEEQTQQKEVKELQNLAQDLRARSEARIQASKAMRKKYQANNSEGSNIDDN